MKPKIGIVGSGNIGWALKQMLKEDYEIRQGDITDGFDASNIDHCLLYTSPSPRDNPASRMPSSA